MPRCGATPPSMDFKPKPHWELGPALQASRCRARHAHVPARGFRVLWRRRARSVSRADQLHARRPHARTRLPGNQAAVPREPRGVDRHGQSAEIQDNVFKSRGMGSSSTAEVPLADLHREEILDGRRFPLETPRPTRRAFAARRAPTGRTRGDSSASTSSTRWNS